MNIAVVVMTHGQSAEPLCKTAEMIVGAQSNIAIINFFPGENVDSLVNKLNERLLTLDTGSGVLFLVDVFGGSPFNAAMVISAQREESDVISGVNIPMLVNCFIERESTSSVKELAGVTRNAGIMGIKSMSQDINMKCTDEDL